MIRPGSGVIQMTGTSPTVLVRRPSDVHVLVEPPGVTPDHAQDAEPAAPTETDWVERVSPFLPKSMREALLGDLLEERAVWRAAGKSRLLIEGATVSQLVLSAFALVCSAGKDLLVDIVKKGLGF